MVNIKTIKLIILENMLLTSLKLLCVSLICQGQLQGRVSEVSGNRSCSDQDTLIEQSITLIKQSQYSEQQCSKLCGDFYVLYQ